MLFEWKNFQGKNFFQEIEEHSLVLAEHLMDQKSRFLLQQPQFHPFLLFLRLLSLLTMKQRWGKQVNQRGKEKIRIKRKKIRIERKKIRIEKRKKNGSDDSTKASSGGSGVTGTRRLSRFEITPVASQGGNSNVVPESQKTQLVEVDWKGNEGRGRKDASSSDPNSIERRQKLEQSHFILPGFPVKSILKSSSATSNAYGYPASYSSATVTYG